MRDEMACASERRHAMTTMGKTLFVVLSLGALFGVTLALRSERDPAPPKAQLTTAQMAEMQPAPKPSEPPKASPTPAADPGDVGQAPEPEPEDGSGS
jgi:cell division protein FtsN